MQPFILALTAKPRTGPTSTPNNDSIRTRRSTSVDVALKQRKLVVRRVAAGIERETLAVVVLVRVVVAADRAAGDEVVEGRVGGGLDGGLGEHVACGVLAGGKEREGEVGCSYRYSWHLLHLLRPQLRWRGGRGRGRRWGSTLRWNELDGWAEGGGGTAGSQWVFIYPVPFYKSERIERWNCRVNETSKWAGTQIGRRLGAMRHPSSLMNQCLVVDHIWKANLR